MQPTEGKESSFGSHSLDKYTRAEPVGGGAYGIVYKGCDTQTGEIIAVKRIKIEVENEGIPSNAIREIALLREIDHENVIKYFVIAKLD